MTQGITRCHTSNTLSYTQLSPHWPAAPMLGSDWLSVHQQLYWPPHGVFHGCFTSTYITLGPTHRMGRFLFMQSVHWDLWTSVNISHDKIARRKVGRGEKNEEWETTSAPELVKELISISPKNCVKLLHLAGPGLHPAVPSEAGTDPDWSVLQVLTNQRPVFRSRDL